MGKEQSKEVVNTGEVVNEITTITPQEPDSKIIVLLLIIAIIKIIELAWRLHSSYRGNLKRKYKSSATLADI